MGEDIISGKIDEEHIAKEDRACTNCVHREVCEILSNTQEMLSRWGRNKKERKQPFDVKDLAEICNYYAPRED